MRVLVADSDWAAAVMVKNALQADGHEVQLAYDGQDAVASAQTFRPEIVILDFDLARLGGLDAARHIRGEAGSRLVSFIAMSYRSGPSDRAVTRLAGFSAHLGKPVDLVALRQAFDEIRISGRSYVPR